MLRPDPNQCPRLEEIAENLEQRLEEARQHGWLGEVEGIEASVAAAKDKLDRMSHIVSLGIPSFVDETGTGVPRAGKRSVTDPTGRRHAHEQFIHSRTRATAWPDD